MTNLSTACVVFLLGVKLLAFLHQAVDLALQGQAGAGGEQG
jgi:hypothetical protein